MNTALVVDDSRIDRRVAGALLENRMGMQVTYAENGIEALEIISNGQPRLVLTDMQMEGMDGLELTQQVRRRFPAVPVIVMTAHGSEEVAAEALRRGAASYVPKKYLSRDLKEIVDSVLAIAGELQQQEMVFEALKSNTLEFVFDNNPARIQPIIGFLRKEIHRARVCDETELTRMGVALDEAISNAIHHGNLEVSSELRIEDSQAYWDAIEARRHQQPWCDRKVKLTVTIAKDAVTYTVRDHGKGFDPSILPDPTDPMNLGAPSGRGLLLIRTFMDEVSHAEGGTVLTMVKHCGNGCEPRSDQAAKANAACESGE